MTIIQRRHGRLLAVAGLALAGLAAGCGRGTAPAPAGPVTAGPIPARAGLYSSVPAACSLLDTAALRALGLTAKGTAQPVRRTPGLQEQYCTWAAPAVTRTTAARLTGSQRQLTIIEDLFTYTATTGQAPATAAQEQFEQEVSSQAQADGTRARRVPSLASGAFIEYVARGTLGASQVQVRDQNVMLNVAYAGLPAGGRPASRSTAENSALTAARAALTTLGAFR